MPPPEVLRTPTVTLRRWDMRWARELEDAIQASLPELMRFMPWASERHTIEDSRTYIAQSVADWGAGVSWNYAMFLDGPGLPDDAGLPDSSGGDDEPGRGEAPVQVLGSCGLMTRMGPDVLEIGYWVRSKYAGRGYATDAAAVLATEGLRMPGIDRIAIRHDVANPASGRVAARAGFSEVAELDGPVEAVDQTGVELLWERRS
jgi:ribosomal-protein-serine acetyltransferase